MIGDHCKTCQHYRVSCNNIDTIPYCSKRNNIKAVSFGYGLVYIDEYDNEQMICMTSDAYHQFIDEMVRCM